MLSVRGDGHPEGPNADTDGGDHRVAESIDHRHRSGGQSDVFDVPLDVVDAVIGDVDERTIGADRDRAGEVANGNGSADGVVRAHVDDGHRAVVVVGHIDAPEDQIGRQCQGAAPDGNGLEDRVGDRVDDCQHAVGIVDRVDEAARHLRDVPRAQPTVGDRDHAGVDVGGRVQNPDADATGVTNVDPGGSETGHRRDGEETGRGTQCLADAGRTEEFAHKGPDGRRHRVHDVRIGQQRCHGIADDLANVAAEGSATECGGHEAPDDVRDPGPPAGVRHDAGQRRRDRGGQSLLHSGAAHEVLDQCADRDLGSLLYERCGEQRVQRTGGDPGLADRHRGRIGAEPAHGEGDGVVDRVDHRHRAGGLVGDEDVGAVDGKI